MSDVLILDSTTAIRDWLRSLNLASIGAQWFAGKLPAGYDPASPAGVITRVGGATLEPCLDRPMLQLSIYANSGALVGSIAAATQSAFESVERTKISPTGDPTLLLLGARTVSNLDAPDPETGGPRRVLTVDVTTVAIP